MNPESYVKKLRTQLKNKKATDAACKIVEEIEPFDRERQERILKAASIMLGIVVG